MGGTSRSGEFVVPGDRLGVIEEFIPNSGTFVEDDKVYSKVTGRILLDFANKKISVYPLTRATNIPKVGSIVTGIASSLQDSTANIRMIKVGRRYLSGPFTGVLYISDVSFEYVETMFDAYRMGDIIRAKVISNKNRVYHLSTKGADLGAIYAFCSRCGDLLKVKNREMRCENCGNIEKRKVASDYEKGF